MRRTAAAVAVAATMGTAGCKADIALSVFASDVIAAHGGATDRAVTAVVGIEAIRCLERGPEALPALQEQLPGVEFIGCRDGGMETFAEFRARLPLLPAEPAGAAPALLNVALKPHDEGGKLALFYLDGTRMDATFRAMPQDIRASIAGELEPAISLRVHNDTASDWTFTVQGVFVDGQARQMPTDVTLPPRGEAMVRLSDVGNAALRGNRPILFILAQ